MNDHAYYGKRVPQANKAPSIGPYSPVLEVSGKEFVVTSGQLPLDDNGNIAGDTIEEQTQATLNNCQKQLQSAGATFEDVFKVVAYISDLDLWARFNKVYEATLAKPYPVRTVVQAGLLKGFLIEIEMWAVKK